MTWKNLPCAPTLPALFAACPHGWAELVVTDYAGSLTSDPPQDASRGIEIGRVYGVENSDLSAVVDLIMDIDEDGIPVGYPRGDCVLLVRIDHGSERCSECDRPRPEDHRGPLCHPGYSQDGGCSGSFIVATTASALWGEGGKAVYCDGNEAPAYMNPDQPRARIEDGPSDSWPRPAGITDADEAWLHQGAPRIDGNPVIFMRPDGTPATGDDITAAALAEKQPPPQPGVGDMWQQVIDRCYADGTAPDIIAIFEKRREMGLAKYKTPLQAGNGRNPLRDLLDETLDRIVYIEQAITEQPGRSASLRTEQDNDVELVEVLLGMQGFEDTGEECRAKYLRSIGEADPMRAAATNEPPVLAAGQVWRFPKRDGSGYVTWRLLALQSDGRWSAGGPGAFESLRYMTVDEIRTGELVTG